MNEIGPLSEAEIKAAALLSLRNKNLSEEDITYVKRNLCGRMSTDGLNITCYVCSAIVKTSSAFNADRAIFFISHIREHLKNLQIYL
jgi:hypothetical protein